MNIEESILEKLRLLPVEKQQEVLYFAGFLVQKIAVANNSIKENWPDEPFVGMWQNREEMSDRSAWARQNRQQEWRE